MRKWCAQLVDDVLMTDGKSFGNLSTLIRQLWLGCCTSRVKALVSPIVIPGIPLSLSPCFSTSRPLVEQRFYPVSTVPIINSIKGK